ncbi:MAG: hypothetical protein ACRCXB_23995 [Aeromonadaceae bacterium]
MKRNSLHWRRWLLCSPLMVLSAAVLLLLVNNFGCNYELDVRTATTHYQGVCRWGHVSFVEQELSSGEKWLVTGWQLAFREQLAFVITQRKRLVAASQGESELADYNRLQSAFSVVNYTWLPLTENRIAIFQRAPHHAVLIGRREGWIDLYRWLIPPQPLLFAQQPAAKPVTAK